MPHTAAILPAWATMSRRYCDAWVVGRRRRAWVGGSAMLPTIQSTPTASARRRLSARAVHPRDAAATVALIPATECCRATSTPGRRRRKTNIQLAY